MVSVRRNLAQIAVCFYQIVEGEVLVLELGSNFLYRLGLSMSCSRLRNLDRLNHPFLEEGNL